ncbi:MAG TPA: hypothetical protein VF584_08145 [Longimicrobium sp.]|jgi:hypothetical protein
MKEKLLTVEESFEVAGRGLIVIPVPIVAAVPGPADLDVELRRPDGSRRDAVLSILHAFGQPPTPEPRRVCLFRGLRKEDVPPGTEIWREADNIGRPPAAVRHTETRET